jgi:hypothetical protein
MRDSIIIVRFEVFTAVTMKNADFWDVALCISCVNRRFGGIYHLQLQSRKIRERGTSVSRWLQSAGFTQVLHGATSQKTAFFSIIIDLNKLWPVNLNWICRVHNGAQWKAFVDTVISSRVSYAVGNFLAIGATVNY